MAEKTTQEEIIEVVNKLFIYTDDHNWTGLLSEVFTEDVQFDMTSMEGPNELKKAADICEMWSAGFDGIDEVNHLAGNHVVNIKGDEADVFCYATATHFKKSAKNGQTRDYVGTYDLHMIDTGYGWRINGFAYNLKFLSGNTDLT